MSTGLEGNTIGNLTITGATATANGFTVPDDGTNEVEERSNNLGLVLGLSIPLVLILVLLVLIFKFRQRKESTNANQYAEPDGFETDPNQLKIYQ